jgi:hypothetical protein
MAKTPAQPPEKGPADEARPGVDPAMAASLKNLSPEQAAQVLAVLEKALKRRKIQLWGYLVAGIVLIIGMLAALYVYGATDEGTFVGWVFFVPVGLVGIVLYGFGAWSERHRTALEDRFEREQRAPRP